MHDAGVLKRAAFGAAAGIGGTFVVQALMAASKQWAPTTLPPMRQDPGEFMVQQAEEALPVDPATVPETAETAAATSLAMGYGLTAGTLYALLRSKSSNVLLDGTLLGLLVWGVGYLGWLPALELMPPVTEHEPAQIAGPIVSHAIFGVITTGIYRLLRQLL